MRRLHGLFAAALVLMLAVSASLFAAAGDGKNKGGKAEKGAGQTKAQEQGGAEKEAADDTTTPSRKEVNPRPTLGAAVSRQDRQAEAEKARAELDKFIQESNLPVIDVTPKRILLKGDLTLQVRVTQATPPEPADVMCSYGYGGSAAAVVRASLGSNVPVGTWTKPRSFEDILKGDADLKKGSPDKARKAPRVSDAGIELPRDLFLRICGGAPGVLRRTTQDGMTQRTLEGYATKVEMEIELSYNGEVIKRLTNVGPDGGSCTVRFPFERMENGDPKTPGFLSGICGLLDVAKQRTAMLRELPWGSRPLPRKYAIVSNLGGYGAGRNDATADKNVMYAEMECMRELGVNGLRALGHEGGAFFAMLNAHQGAFKDFTRAYFGHAMGYPVPRREGRNVDPAALKCPSQPGVAEAAKEGVAASLQSLLKYKVDQSWGITVDEIGAVTTAEHLAACPDCAAAFQKWLREQGRTPAEFGKKDWSEVKPVANVAPADWKKDPGLALAVYYTNHFRSCASARLFGPLGAALNAENDKKRKALASGDTASAAAKQPWLYAYALRTSAYLREGTGLDYTEWYRLGENGFAFETTERDKRVGQLTAILNDVQRAMAAETGVKLGVELKPHRGQTVTIQRMLACISRGVEYIYWYTYGPEWGKGDNFCRPQFLSQVSKAVRLLAAGEDVTYDSSWAVQPEVAWVSSIASSRWRSLPPYPEKEWHIASWEDAKWTHVALAHAHISVDVVDEPMLEKRDLSRYKVIYAICPVLTWAAAQKLEAWVKAGGTLYTSAWGLVYDEAMRPLDVLQPVLGLQKRTDPQTWCDIRPTSASGQQDFANPRSMYELPPHDKTALQGGGIFHGAFKPMLGREVLVPSAGTEVQVKFADGTAAVTRHPYGKGQAYVVGLWPGIEYSYTIRHRKLDMTKDFDPNIRLYATAAAAEKVRPVVDVSEPCVEGILLKNNKTGKLAVTLANWAQKVTAIRHGDVDPTGMFETSTAVLQNVKVTLRGAGAVTAVKSAWLQQALPVQQVGDAVVVTVPRLEEGDVLLLE